MRVLMNEGRELHRGREAVQQANPFAARRTERAPRSSRNSTPMPCPRIAALSNAVFPPGSPDASLGSASGSPSVCSTSYLGIPQPGPGYAAVDAEIRGAVAAHRIAFARGHARESLVREVFGWTPVRSDTDEAAVSVSNLVRMDGSSVRGDVSGQWNGRRPCESLLLLASWSR
jgi:hypothetical protein